MKTNPIGLQLLEKLADDGFERIVEMSPAFDRRNPDPNKNYGIGSVRIKFVLKGEHGATHFMFSSGWYLPHVRDELARDLFRTPTRQNLDTSFAPTGYDVGYHDTTPHYEGQEAQNDCPYLNGKPCYTDGSALASDVMLDKLIREGSEGVWRELREWYDEKIVSARSAVKGEA